MTMFLPINAFVSHISQFAQVKTNWSTYLRKPTETAQILLSSEHVMSNALSTTKRLLQNTLLQQHQQQE